MRGKEIDLNAVRSHGKPFIWSFATVSSQDSLDFANDLAQRLTDDRQYGQVILTVRPRTTTVVYEFEAGRSTAEVMIR